MPGRCPDRRDPDTARRGDRPAARPPGPRRTRGEPGRRARRCGRGDPGVAAIPAAERQRRPRPVEPQQLRPAGRRDLLQQRRAERDVQQRVTRRCRGRCRRHHDDATRGTAGRRCRPRPRCWHTLGQHGSLLDLRAELADWPVGSASVAVIGPDGVLDMVDDGQTYPWASVTKVITAITVLDAHLRGRRRARRPGRSARVDPAASAVACVRAGRRLRPDPGPPAPAGCTRTAASTWPPSTWPAAPAGRSRTNVRAGAGPVGHDRDRAGRRRRRTARAARSPTWRHWPPTCYTDPAAAERGVAGLDGRLPGLAACCPGSAGSRTTTGALAARSATTRARTGPRRTTPTGHLRSFRPVRAASCGSTRWPSWPVCRCPTPPSDPGPPTVAQAVGSSAAGPARASQSGVIQAGYARRSAAITWPARSLGMTQHRWLGPAPVDRPTPGSARRMTPIPPAAG